MEKKEIEELDFPSSDESLDEVEEESSKVNERPFLGLSAKKQLNFKSRSRFMS